jgi:hypothetical protein
MPEERADIGLTSKIEADLGEDGDPHDKGQSIRN